MLGRPFSALTWVAAVLLSGPVALPTLSAHERPGCVEAGDPLSFVVDFPQGTSSEDATSRIAAACGSSTIYYPEIAVGAATSAAPEFADRLGTGRAFSAQAELRATRGAAGPAPVRTPVPKTEPADVPRSDRTAEQWDMRAINAEQARKIEPGSRNVVVGVLDSGIDPTHPDLARALAPKLSAGCLSGAPEPDATAWSATTSPHGTHVAGAIAAADNGAGVTGVAPGVRLASIKVIDDRGDVSPEAAVCGLMWAAKQRMKVTNSSFLVDPWAVACAHGEDHELVREVLDRALAYSTAAGTVNVAAATNESVALTPSPRSGTTAGSPGASCEALPAGLRDVVTVSSVGANRVKAGYSSYGLGVIDVTAPGGDSGDCVLSTVPGGYAPLCGTSMAAPHVAGVLALMASAHPEYPPARLRRTLEREAVPILCPASYDLAGDGDQDGYCAGYEDYNGFYGHGIADALAAVAPQPRPGPGPGEATHREPAP